jgi:uncharacterized Fe-S cluster-containing MiaB family protein
MNWRVLLDESGHSSKRTTEESEEIERKLDRALHELNKMRSNIKLCDCKKCMKEWRDNTEK